MLEVSPKEMRSWSGRKACNHRPSPLLPPKKKNNTNKNQYHILGPEFVGQRLQTQTHFPSNLVWLQCLSWRLCYPGTERRLSNSQLMDARNSELGMTSVGFTSSPDILPLWQTAELPRVGTWDTNTLPPLNCRAFGPSSNTSSRWGPPLQEHPNAISIKTLEQPQESSTLQGSSIFSAKRGRFNCKPETCLYLQAEVRTWEAQTKHMAQLSDFGVWVL